MAFKSSNLPLTTTLKVIEYVGCKCIREEKGHYKYARKDLLRPIVIQTHIDPVPEFIIKQIMRTLNLSNKDMEEILKAI